MKKTALLLGIILTFSLVATGCGKDTTGNQDQLNTAEEAQEENFLGKSLKEMMGLGKTLKCEIALEDEETQTSIEQTMYLDGERFRVDSDINMPESEMGKMTYHMISDGEWIYTWSTEQEAGLKMNIAKMEEMGQEFKENSDLAEGGKVDLDQRFDFNCIKWKKDSSLLVPPSDVEFTDYLEQIESFTNALENMDFGSGEDLCSLCDFETSEEGKQDCLAELGC